jgi:hypothetical protein
VKNNKQDLLLFSLGSDIQGIINRQCLTGVSGCVVVTKEKNKFTMWDKNISGY